MTFSKIKVTNLDLEINGDKSITRIIIISILLSVVIGIVVLIL
jgi:hypothetical protein